MTDDIINHDAQFLNRDDRLSLNVPMRVKTKVGAAVRKCCDAAIFSS